ARAGHIDVAVNNAAFVVAGLAETATPEQLLRELDTNVVGMQRVNRAVLPGMRARRNGLLVHLSSVSGRMVIPFLGAYAASKWAIEALAEAYRYELKGVGVDVSIVQPGSFPTRLVRKSEIGADLDRRVGYGQLAKGLDRLVQRMEGLFALPSPPDPEEVAAAIVALVEAPS